MKIVTLTSNERFDCMSNRQTLAYWRVDKVQKLGIWLGGIQVGRFAGVYD